MAFIPHEINDQPTALYRLFNATGQLLYVGITNNLHARFTAHKSDKGWWPQVSETVIVWYETRPEAADAEKKAISTENPLHDQSYRQGAGALLPRRPVPVPAPPTAAANPGNNEPQYNQAWARMLRLVGELPSAEGSADTPEGRAVREVRGRKATSDVLRALRRIPNLGR